ncbi:hypothetical protein ACHAQJ_001473 [Trichoderma viride]
MAEELKPVDVAVPVAEEVAAPAPVVVAEETPVVETAAPVAEDKPVEESKPAETEEAEAPKEEDKKEEEEEAKPIEEGFLGHKAQGASFPKNFIASKAFFFFGSESVESDLLAAYKRVEKHAEVAQHNIAWAAHTGKGLLFVGDKKAPTGVINLADATEPETDGSNKFHFTAKGNKHSFKAISLAERDNWVAQLKEKIAEAKELATTVTESDVYKQTIESFKPAPKEEKVEAPKEEAAPAEETAAKTEEPAKEEETAKEETKDELKVEEPKRRSASRKRASFFGFGKKEEKKDEAKTEETAAVETPAVVEPVSEVEAPAATEETPAAEPTAEAETKASEELQPESPKEKPAVNKRTSFFGNVFSKKEKKAAEAKPEIESPKEEEEIPTTETAPVIPPVEATTPLGAVDVSTPTTVPTETPEVAVTNGESKKEKEKRKSSLPFTFGKRDKSPGPASEGEEKTSKGAFSKLRATIKGKGAAKSDEKTVEEGKEESKEDDVIKEEEAPATEEIAKEEEAAKPEEPEAENKPEGVAAATPAVTAAA